MMMCRPLLTRWAIPLPILWLFIPAVQSLIGEDRLCSLYTFLHFTNNGTPAFSIDGKSGANNPGFNHMASALMAMEHFNTRNTSVVKELVNFTDCSIQFDMNQSLFFDTGTVGHKASQSLHRQQKSPCAIAGPFHDRPALELSTMATAAEFPLVAHRAFNTRVSSNESHPYSSQVFPDLFASSLNLVHFLMDKGRTNYTSFLYALTDAGSQRREALSLVFDIFEMRSRSYPYFSLPQEAIDAVGSRDILTEMKRMKANGYRTIVVGMEDPLLEMPLLADAAEELQMNNGDYLWVWFGNFEPVHLEQHTENMQKVIAGSAWLSPFEESVVMYNTTPFYRAWVSQGQEFIDRLNEMNPIQPGNVGYVFANSTYLTDFEYGFGTGFLYDAVITIGMGACLAERKNGGNRSKVEGIEHVGGIRRVDFNGASGRVLLGEGPDVTHARLGTTVYWAVINLLPPYPTGKEHGVDAIVSDILFPEGGDWIEVNPFVYADGRTVPPDLLRDPPEQNYLSSGLRAFGLTLLTVALLFSVVSALWVFVRRNHNVLRASQPRFLYVLVFGSAVTASTIFTISFDEGTGWSVTSLSHACMATPWLVCLGHIITYGALFSKLWRVNRVLQFARRKVDFRHVIWPSIILFMGAIIVLTVWTAVDPLKWEREEVNEITGESIGECKCEHYWAYLSPLMGILAVTTILAAYMAWKTKDVDDAYSESKWIFILILVQVEVMFVATPIVIILYTTSSDGRYAGFSLTLWIFAMSALLLIMIPKMIAYRKAVEGSNDRHKPKRGEKAHGRVTGVGLPTQEDIVTTQIREASEVASSQHQS